MANFLYVDRSNVWIEGMHVRAVVEGRARDIRTAQQKNLTARWNMDFGRLLSFAGGNRPEIGRAVLYGSRPPPSDSIWAAAERVGFEVIVYDRNIANKEKKIDTKITTDMISDSFRLMRPGQDELTLVAGDRDYVPPIEDLIGRGFNVHVCFWDHAGQELKDVCSSFTSLNAHMDLLTFVETASRGR